MTSGNRTTGPAAVTVFICVTCRGPGGDDDRPGRLLFDAVTASLDRRADYDFTTTPVACLSVCKRPCTIALAATGKWTYVVGDLDHEHDVGDVVGMALRYGSTEDGIIPWRDRPQSFRKGVVSRIPPPGFRPEGS
jgi:predicted metal-binding protein